MSGAKAALVSAAVRLFQAKGYEAVGVADILAASGLPKGSLYHHFPAGKEALAAAAVAFIAEEVDHRLAALFAQGLPPQAVLERIAAATAAWLKQTKFTQGALIAALAPACGPQTPLLTAEIRQAHRRWIKRFAPAGGPSRRQAMAALAWLEGAVLLARAHRTVAPLQGAPAFFAAYSAAD